MAGLGDPRIVELLDEVRRQPSFPVYQRVGKRLGQRDLHDLGALAGRRAVRLAVLSSFTIDPIVAYLRVGCLERDILPEIFVPGFNQFAQQLLDPASALYAFGPDVCFLQVPLEDLVATAAGPAPAAGAEAVIGRVRDLVSAFQRSCRGDLVIANFAAPGRFPHLLERNEVVEVHADLNQRLSEMTAATPGVHILDYEALTAFHGKGAVSDERLRHIARMEVGPHFLPKLAAQMLAWVVALRGLGRKCIVLDLDNTLWGGLVGEEGVDDIQLGAEYPGSAFVEFQQALLALQRRGILLAINSKNDEAEALAALDRHPAMVLRRECFAAMRINWKDKCENIEALAAELNLGLDAMVFIDDSPTERELMRRLRPEVLTPEWPADPVLYVHALESLCDFATLTVTQEDRGRGEMYAAEGRREELKQRSATLEEYLFGLQMEASITQAEAGDVPRVHQLIQKTNQFNLTSRRYSSGTLAGFLQDAAVTTYVLSNRDIFGDNGLVGIAIVVRENAGHRGPAWRIDALLMSCRVLGRTIEQAFLHHLLAEAQREGARSVIGEFIPTGRNAMVRDFYPGAGFQLHDRSEAAERWIMDLTAYRPPPFPWLRMNSNAVVGAGAAAGGAA